MKVSVHAAISLLKQGDIVAIPTETVYGLAGSIHQPSAIKKIFTAKARPSFDPLIVHIGHPQQLLPLVESFGPAAQKLAKEFWPGPLTLVLKKSDLVSDEITSGHKTVALRMPHHPLALEILMETGPLAAPSANKFGKVSPTVSSHVESEFNSQIPVVEGGPCSVGLESTILKVDESTDHIQLTLLRPGMISPEDIAKTLVSFKKNLQWQEPSSAIAPGQLANHYQPTVPLVLSFLKTDWNNDLHLQICKELKIEPSKSSPILWSLQEDDPRLVARIMYAQMRTFSERLETPPYIFLKTPKLLLTPEWSAICDRLNKASSLKIEQNNQTITFQCK